MANKKKGKGLKVFLIILLVIALPIGAIYALFFDSSTVEVNKDPNFSMETMGEQIVVDSLDYASKDEHMISFKLEEDMLNQALMSATSDLENVLGGVAKKVYMVMEENSYNFYIDISVPMFQTRICLVTVLENVEDNFYFTIKDVKVGRVGGFTWVIDQFLNDSMLNELLSSTGLSITSDLANHRLVYGVDELISDLEALGALNTANLYTSMINEFITSDELVSYDFYSEHSLSINVHLDKLHNSESYDETYDLNLNIDAIKTIVENEIDSNDEFEITTDNITTLFQNTFKEEFALEIGSGDTIKNIITSQVQSNFSTLVSTGDNFEVTLTEESINNYLKKSDILGNTAIFHRDDNGHRKVNYITVDNFYVNLYSQEEISYADFVVGININGYETVASIKTDLHESTSGKLVFALDDAEFKFGSLDIGVDLKDDFISYLANGLSHSNDDTIHLNEDTNEVVIDFFNAIKGTAEGTFIENNCTVSSTVYGESFATQNSGIKIKISL